MQEVHHQFDIVCRVWNFQLLVCGFASDRKRRKTLQRKHHLWVHVCDWNVLLGPDEKDFLKTG